MVGVFLLLVIMTKMMMKQTWCMKELIKEWMKEEDSEGFFIFYLHFEAMKDVKAVIIYSKKIQRDKFMHSF